jgi:predicted nucleic acid-binding protein
VKYLLDVNALIALGLFGHTFHTRVTAWLKSERQPELLTCSITELGFIRVLAQTPLYKSDIERAQSMLAAMKQIPYLTFAFLDNDQGAAGLPLWVRTGGQTTDGHLTQLAGAHGAILATFDAKILGAFLIP